MERLMAVQAKLELEERPHEADGTTKFHKLYEGHEFVDDVSGLFFNKELAIQARKLEIDFFKRRGVFENVPTEWMHVISTCGLTRIKVTKLARITAPVRSAEK